MLDLTWLHAWAWAAMTPLLDTLSGPDIFLLPLFDASLCCLWFTASWWLSSSRGLRPSGVISFLIPSEWSNKNCTWRSDIRFIALSASSKFGDQQFSRIFISWNSISWNTIFPEFFHSPTFLEKTKLSGKVSEIFFLNYRVETITAQRQLLCIFYVSVLGNLI